GKTRPAVVFTGVGVTIGLIAVLGDLTLGEILDRGRPLALSDNPNPAFPSGHVFGSTVFFGFMGFLAVYYKLKPEIFFPLLAVFGITIILAGPARVHLQAHFPSDVAAGYLLGALWLMVIIPVFLFVRRTQWMSAQQNKENLAVAACGSCKVASSIASVVVLDPVQGTATKVYTPPPLVRLIYWMAVSSQISLRNQQRRTTGREIPPPDCQPPDDTPVRQRPGRPCDHHRLRPRELQVRHRVHHRRGCRKRRAGPEVHG
ncbi:MAG: hypothetical protein DSY79_03350, partial [Chloroflexi bacterium]